MTQLIRPRRLRESKQMRNLVRETRISKKALIYPLFVEEGQDIRTEIAAMPGQIRYSPDTLYEGVERAAKAGIQAVLLFGIPKHKDEQGSGAWVEDGVVQQATRAIKHTFKDMLVITDVCLCEYTSHGHCGLLSEDTVENDATLPLLSKTALSHVQAGADIVAPSDMMDGRVQAIRSALDAEGYADRALLSYAVKYASAFYGPFREAAGSAPSFGDRKTYQMDYHNSREATKEAMLDCKEGADMLIVKPALSYLDIVQNISACTNVPIATYSVSGEYSMIKAAAAAGYAKEEALVMETTVAMFRAGADMLITYYAKEIARMIDEGRMG